MYLGRNFYSSQQEKAIAQALVVQHSKAQLMDQLRQYRNRISYEGFSINTEYLERRKEEIDDLIDVLIALIKERL